MVNKGNGSKKEKPWTYYWGKATLIADECHYYADSRRVIRQIFSRLINDPGNVTTRWWLGQPGDFKPIRYSLIEPFLWWIGPPLNLPAWSNSSPLHMLFFGSSVKFVHNSDSRKSYKIVVSIPTPPLNGRHDNAPDCPQIWRYPSKFDSRRSGNSSYKQSRRNEVQSFTFQAMSTW